MQYVAAYALLVLGGKAQPTEADIKGLLAEVGAQGADDQIKGIVDALKGKTLSDVISEGLKKVGTLQLGGGAASSAPAQTQAPAAAKQEAPKPVEKAPEPEEDVDMGGLFD
ncbi:unnamed protein product [Paramecium primaurelia]|uniref:60S acidic ribosomal protein P2 n=2 Tax=Paramecium TaxID=5884 RepID=A0A8S1ST80_9CILI|nr:unnamed protein product [Paramecium primaurelia]CAD8141704.1 unnamed protein product [Paramecium pentaurelia]